MHFTRGRLSCTLPQTLTILAGFSSNSPSQDMQHCLCTGCLQLAGGQRFLSQRTEPSRHAQVEQGSEGSSHVSPLARSPPSCRQPAGGDVTREAAQRRRRAGVPADRRWRTFAGLAARLRDGMRARGEGAGLALTVHGAVGADARAAGVGRVVEALGVPVAPLLVCAVRRRSWKEQLVTKRLESFNSFTHIS